MPTTILGTIEEDEDEEEAAEAAEAAEEEATQTAAAASSATAAAPRPSRRRGGLAETGEHERAGGWGCVFQYHQTGEKRQGTAKQQEAKKAKVVTYVVLTTLLTCH